MSNFDDIKAKATAALDQDGDGDLDLDDAKAAVAGKKDTIKSGIETAGDKFDAATDNKHAETVDQVQEKAHNVVDGLAGDQ